MPNAPQTPSPGEIDHLRSRITQLEADLARARQDASNLERFRRLLEGVAAAPWEMRLDAPRFTWVGPQAEGLLGFPLDDWYAPRFWEERLHPEDRDATVRLCAEELALGRDHALEYRMVGAGGRVVWVLDVVRVVSEAGKPVLAWGLLFDVGALRRGEERLFRVQKREAMRALAGGVAHSFNNLLTSVLGYAELAANEPRAAVAARGYLEEVMRAATRGGDLTRQLLTAVGKGRTSFQAVDLSALVQEASRGFPAAVAEAELRWECATLTPFIEADASQLLQVVRNLVANAVEAMAGRPGAVVIRTGVRLLEHPDEYGAHAASDLPPGRYVSLEVTDAGCGMNKALVERIFDPFFTTKFPGRGLGLATVLGVVESHRGVVRVTTAPGQGSTFEVLFPALDGALTPSR
jgi:PAS domain S-box-containing protein